MKKEAGENGPLGVPPAMNMSANRTLEGWREGEKREERGAGLRRNGKRKGQEKPVKKNRVLLS